MAAGVADLPGPCWNEDSDLSLLNNVPRHMSSRSRRYAYAHQPQPQSRVGPKPLMMVRERTNGQSGHLGDSQGRNGPPHFSSFDYTPGMLARSLTIYPNFQRHSTRMVSCTEWIANNTIQNPPRSRRWYDTRYDTSPSLTPFRTSWSKSVTTCMRFKI